MSANLLNDLIKKTSDYDKDQRFMATSDIINHLTKDVKIDEVLEKKICSAILKQLDDKSNDVQSVAVKCLGILVKKVHSAQITDICDKLCSLILDGQDALRDIYSIGLKTLISDIPEEHGAIITARLVNRLIFGISRTVGQDEIIKECLENMNDLLRRFGSLLSNEHEEIMKAIIKQLVHDKAVIKKRAAICLGSLSVVLSDSQLNHLVELLLSQSTAPLDTRTLIQTFGAISRTVGHRLGRQLDRLIPLFLRCCGDPNDENQQTNEANELREYCFLGLESFVLRCRREVTPYLQDVIGVALAFMKYDPNYSYDEPDDATMGDGGDDDYYDGGGEEEDDYAGSDDDDGSWKVRKSAVKVMMAIILSRPDLLSSLYDQCADLLLSRFKDREETVRLDIIAAYTSLLQMSINIVGSSKLPQKPTASSPRSPQVMSRKAISFGSVSSSEVMTILSKVKGRVAEVMKASRTHFEHGSSLKTKSALFGLFKSLVLILKGDMDAYLHQLFTWVEAALQDKNQSLKIDALVFARSLVDHYQASSFHPYYHRFLTIAMNACNDDWYKIIAEGLRYLASIIIVMRPVRADDDEMELINEVVFTVDVTMANNIYTTVYGRLDAMDIDQEIKECSIYCMGKVFAHLGDLLSNQLLVILSIFRKRLENEVTRSTTLHAILDIARSPLHLDVSSFTSESMKDLAYFLRQQSRSLKLNSLQTMDELLASRSSANIDANTMRGLLSTILHELASIISDHDLSLAHGGLRLLYTVITKFSSSSISIIKVELYANLTQLASSSILQGQALVSLVEVYKALSMASSADLSYDQLFQDLYKKNIFQSSSAAALSKQSAMNLAKCIAGITANAKLEIQIQTLDIFIADLQSSSSTSSHRQLTLFCIGEVGYHVKIDKNLQVKEMVIQCFDSDVEEVRGAAAYALGHLAMGAMPIFLPIIVQAMDSNQSSNPRYQYLLLSSLREIIQLHLIEEKSFDSYLASVLPGIQHLAHTSDDGLRNMVADCIGSLTLLNSVSMLPWLQGLLSHDQSDVMIKWTAATALRHSMSRPLVINSALWISMQSSIRSFLLAIYDEDLEVRKSYLSLINSIVHHNPSIIIDLMNDLITAKLFETLTFKQEKVVDLGPFKHKVDEGLPLRKAALTAIETILDTIPERLDVSTFLSLAIELLIDKDEVKLQTHQVTSTRALLLSYMYEHELTVCFCR
jgi:cullin-associated NEDD8-dissociated protein 1